MAGYADQYPAGRCADAVAGLEHAPHAFTTPVGHTQVVAWCDGWTR